MKLCFFILLLLFSFQIFSIEFNSDFDSDIQMKNQHGNATNFNEAIKSFEITGKFHDDKEVFEKLKEYYLFESLSFESDIEITKLLLENGVDPNVSRLHLHETILEKAAHHNNVKAIDLLLDFGADPTKVVRIYLGLEPITFITKSVFCKIEIRDLLKNKIKIVTDLFLKNYVLEVLPKELVQIVLAYQEPQTDEELVILAGDYAKLSKLRIIQFDKVENLSQVLFNWARKKKLDFLLKEIFWDDVLSHHSMH